MSFHCEIFQLGIVPPNPLVPLMNSLSEFHQFVSYLSGNNILDKILPSILLPLSIKSPKSLKNKDFTTKSLFLKDLGEIDPEVFDSKRPIQEGSSILAEGIRNKDRSFAAAQITLCSVSYSPYFSLSIRAISSRNSRVESRNYCLLNTSFSVSRWPVSNVPVVDTVICCPSAETTHLSF